VLFDLINPGQNLVLPVVAINIKSISRDESRIFNKSYGFVPPTVLDPERLKDRTPYVKSPVPVNISLDMSILTKNQIDMDQILSNFIPYNNPYIIISWKVPEEHFPNYTHEIRTEVLWDGNVALNYPVEVNGTQKAQVISDTSFTIKGWLFPYVQDPVKNIFKVDANTYSAGTGADLTLSNYFAMSSMGVVVDNDQNIEFSRTISVTGFPYINSVEKTIKNS
jgi:hypothetical protein